VDRKKAQLLHMHLVITPSVFYPLSYLPISFVKYISYIYNINVRSNFDCMLSFKHFQVAFPYCKHIACQHLYLVFNLCFMLDFAWLTDSIVMVDS